jgi:hypothetical protein
MPPVLSTASANFCPLDRTLDGSISLHPDISPLKNDIPQMEHFMNVTVPCSGKGMISFVYPLRDIPGQVLIWSEKVFSHGEDFPQPSLRWQKCIEYLPLP